MSWAIFACHCFAELCRCRCERWLMPPLVFFVCSHCIYAVDMQYTFFVPAYKVYVVVFFFFSFHVLLIIIISGLVTPFLKEKNNTHTLFKWFAIKNTLSSKSETNCGHENEILSFSTIQISHAKSLDFIFIAFLC